MSREEVLDKYGDIQLKFSYYYKYTFIYKAVTDVGTIIIAYVGGCGDEIYRMDLSPKENISALETEDIVEEEPTISNDGNMICVLHGKNLQEGIAGFGKTKEEAIKDFKYNFLRNTP